MGLRTLHRGVACLLLGWWGACGLAWCGQDKAAEPEVRVFTLAGSSLVSELSGLAWHEAGQALYAVSDRGMLAHFRVERDGGGRVQAIELAEVLPIRLPDGSPLPRELDPEGLALRVPAGGVVPELLVVTEKTPRVLRLSLAGVVLGEEALPEALRPVSAYQGGKGLEAIAWHPGHGLMVAPELPLSVAPQGWHRTYGGGTALAWPMSVDGARLKDMAWGDDGRLWFIERITKGKGRGQDSVLRTLDPRTCGPAGPSCQAYDVLVLPNPDGRENFEGLTSVGARQWLAVADNGGKAGRPSAFVWIGLPL